VRWPELARCAARLLHCALPLSWGDTQQRGAEDVIVEDAQPSKRRPHLARAIAGHQMLQT
jgi:hypothetical protein